MYQYVYKYRALRNSEVISGYISGDSIKDAIKIVKYISSKQILIRRSFYLFKTNNIDQISDWFSTLFSFLNEGIKIEDCLEIIGQNSKYKFSITIIDLIRSGFSFSEAISRHSFFFGPVCVKIINSVSGFMKIEEICSFLKDYYSKLGKKVIDTRKILLQPFITFILSMFILFFAAIFLKKNTERLFLDLNIDKPFIFKLMDNLGFYSILIIFFLIFIIFYLCRKFIEKLPFFSSYYESRDILISFYCMSKAISSGVQIINAIEIAMETVETKSIFIKLKGVKNSILNGKSMHYAFKKQNFDVGYCEIIKVGELSGKLCESIMSVSLIAEQRLSSQFEFISNTVPYVFLLITSIAIIFFFYSVFMPIYSSVNKFFF